MNSTPIYTSRSAVETAQACPRLRFLSYEIGRGDIVVQCERPECSATYTVYPADRIPAEFDLQAMQAIECGLCGGTMRAMRNIGGLAPKGKSIYLLVGEAVHAGIERLLQFSMRRDEPPKWDVIDEAVAEALQVFDAVPNPNLHKTPFEHQSWKLAEQRAMVEGLVCAFALVPLPSLLERYRIEAVEQEIAFPLVDNIIFEARLDALLRERDTGDLHVCSFKTAKEWGSIQASQFRRDLQGQTEAMAYERRQVDTKVETWERIQMTQMLILLKGKEYEDKSWGEGSGKWVHYSPLTRAYRLQVDGIVPDQDLSQWAWSYDTMKTYEKGAKKGEVYKGKLGSEWRATSTWDNYPGGMKRWVEDLHKGKWQYEMGDPFAQVFVMPEPWPRSDQEMEDTLVQIICQERDQARKAEILNSMLGSGEASPGEIRQALNVLAPQWRKSCVAYGGVCWADPICFGGDSGRMLKVDDLLAPGSGRVLRSAHHELERGT